MSGVDLWRAPLRGRRLIEASAGTGKTFTLAWTWARLIVERELAPEQILVVTFTDAAAAELRDRLRATLVDALRALEHDDAAAAGVDGAASDGAPGAPSPLPPAAQAVSSWRASLGEAVIGRRLRRALASFDRAMVTTIHGFCRRMLVERAFEAGQPFEAELVAASGGLRARALREAWGEVARGLPDDLVEAAADAKVLKRLVDLATAARPPEIRPDVAVGGPVQALGAARAAVDAAAEALRAAWPGELRALISNLPARMGVNARTYSSRALSELLERLDAATRGEPPPADAHRLDLLDVARLSGALKKNHHLDPALVDELAPAAAWCDAVRAWHAGLQGAVIVVQATVGRTAARRWPATRPSPGALLFDDLLVRLRDALVGAEGVALAAAIRADLPVAMVDEFQDTDPVQWAIFGRLYPDAGHDLMLVGDPKQAIYRFRGADLPTYLAARASVPAVEVLDRNFRSDRVMVDAVHALFASHPDPFLGAGIEWPVVRADRDVSPLAGPLAARGPLGLLRGDDVDDVAADVVAALRSGSTLMERGQDRPLQPSDLAVLCRTNGEARELQAALLARGVPAVRRARESVFVSTAALELGVLLDALLTPSDLGVVRAALGTSLLGLSASELARVADDEVVLGAWLDRLAAWRALWFERGVARLVGEVVEHVGLDALVGRQGGDRLVTNLRHLTELASRAASERGLAPVALRRWLVEAAEDEAAADAELRLESDADAVQVVTLHASKGLEYGLVWIVGLDHHRQKAQAFGVWHEGDALVVDLADPDGDEREAAEERQEAVRLAYVALTRAKHAAVVFVGPPGNRKPERTAIGHLLQLGDWQALSEVAASRGLCLRGADPDARGVRWVAAAQAAAQRAAPAPARRFLPDQRLTSFSALVRGREEELEHEPDLTPRGGGDPVRLATFPRGAEAGTAVHAVLEELDFQDPGGEAAARLVDTQLARHGISAAAWGPTLREGLVDILNTPVLDGGTRLADLPRPDRLDELAFSMWGGRRVSTARLAEALARCELPELRAYAPRLAALGATLDDAVLQGFIDLVFRAEGRVWVVDYKTNHLGDGLDDYTPDACWRAMVEHDYVLQALLYALAVHRFLRLRMPGYAYEAHMGGVRYLFVRGMCPQTGPARGVVAFRPPEALIEAWDRLFAEGA